MPLLMGNLLLQRFAELANRASRIDVAVAWATSCDAIEALAASGAKIRIVVGISNNVTNPSTLQRLTDFAELRIAPDEPPRIFHPKYYCFNGEKTVCWVGSANLTDGGFGSNDELVHEFDVNDNECQNWFECLWESLDPDPMPAIHEYESNYTPTKPKRSPLPKAPTAKRDLPSLADIVTWTDFVEGLRAYNSYYRNHDKFHFDVLGETHSWLHTIRVGRDVVRRNNWTTLTPRECRILLGYTTKDDVEGEWALLGDISASRQASFVFNNEHMPDVGATRQRIRDMIEPVMLPVGNIVDVAHTALQEIRKVRRHEDNFHGIGHAATTRWFALARPDYFVSVNNASAPGLGEVSSLRRDSNGLANVYSDLLNWLHDRPWFNEFNRRQPEDPWDRVIWNCRAALVDVFIYEA